MKRLLSVSLIAVMAASLSACDFSYEKTESVLKQVQTILDDSSRLVGNVISLKQDVEAIIKGDKTQKDSKDDAKKTDSTKKTNGSK